MSNIKITILGSSRQGYITNNYDCTNIHESISYPHYTKEIIQVINFCKHGNLSLEETLFTFRTPILYKNPIYFKLPYNYDINELFDFNYDIVKIKNYLLIIIF